MQNKLQQQRLLQEKKIKTLQQEVENIPETEKTNKEKELKNIVEGYKETLESLIDF